MEIGFMNNRPMIGSRMLVYNPGDLPVDWEIKFDENKRSFWSCRGGTKFRIRRFKFYFENNCIISKNNVPLA